MINGNYKEALDLYNKALELDKTNNYELITCKIGACLNLAYYDQVFNLCDLLINLNNKKPQVS